MTEHPDATEESSPRPDAPQKEQTGLLMNEKEDTAPPAISSVSSPTSQPNLETNQDQAGLENSNNTGDPQENQAQTPPSDLSHGDKESTLGTCLARRQKAVESVLFEKEFGMLDYVLRRFNHAYYAKFRLEANEAFHLAVIYRRRRRERDKIKR